MTEAQAGLRQALRPFVEAATKVTSTGVRHTATPTSNTTAAHRAPL
jgi:hypothetical protein